MKFNKSFIIALFMVFALLGCTHVQEVSKVVWGSSTRALEEARYDAIRANYSCDVYDCFNEVSNIVREEDLDVFIEDRNKDLIVVMGIPDSIETTEVGIFFTYISSENTEIEIASLSPSTKMTTADIVFPSLEKSFSKIK